MHCGEHRRGFLPLTGSLCSCPEVGLWREDVSSCILVPLVGIFPISVCPASVVLDYLLCNIGALWTPYAKFMGDSREIPVKQEAGRAEGENLGLKMWRRWILQ